MIKLHLIKENETLSSISKIYDCDKQNLLKLNPLLKNKVNLIGKIIYIETEEIEIKQIHFEILDKITYLNKEDFTSYINKFNDHILIENELFSNYEKLSKILLKDENDQFIFVTHLKTIHQELHNFIDALQLQNEGNITSIKNKIKEIINNIYLFLINKKIKTSITDVSKIIEFRTLMIAKILNNNYYSVYEMIKKKSND